MISYLPDFAAPEEDLVPEHRTVRKPRPAQLYTAVELGCVRGPPSVTHSDALKDYQIAVGLWSERQTQHPSTCQQVQQVILHGPDSARVPTQSHHAAS